LLVVDPTTVRPIIIQTVDAPAAHELGLGEIILQAVGLTGIILIGSLLLGLALSGGIIWLRTWQARERRAGEAGDQIRLRLEPPQTAGGAARDLGPAMPAGERS
jgi:hypothetical protein